MTLKIQLESRADRDVDVKVEVWLGQDVKGHFTRSNPSDIRLEERSATWETRLWPDRRKDGSIVLKMNANKRLSQGCRIAEMQVFVKEGREWRPLRPLSVSRD